MKYKALALATLVFCGCAGAKSNVRDPERASDSECDVAKDLWLRQHQPRRALEHALKAADLNPQSSEAQHLIALLYLDFCSQGPQDCRLSDAEQAAKRALSLRPEFREAKNTLAVILIHQKKFDAAIALLKPLTEDILYQTPEHAWGNLGWAQLEKGNLNAARDALRRSIAAQPLFCVGSYRLGLAEERQKQLSLAFDSYTRAVETSAPGCNVLQEAWLGRGRVQAALGQAEQARSDLERCIAIAGHTNTAKECRSMLGKLK